MEEFEKDGSDLRGAFVGNLLEHLGRMKQDAEVLVQTIDGHTREIHTESGRSSQALLDSDMYTQEHAIENLITDTRELYHNAEVLKEHWQAYHRRFGTSS